ncbi:MULTISPECIES: MerR family transcriptional regulator [Tsukamurella]|uniref:MerR family transcriptional regulator n=2 Tax=Tsukamurella TaxID=2060 RepID=A0A5C5RYV8_9ACTN|nr:MULTISPECIES: MerR family transcriptional regulator [Tsukamurella]NMD57093.1 MerR family transcriptional regulator [Tsukamurella columbiensis]TWS27683.1 MerR family transcriptional regulator [Tsukamurella conjunctivitidis]
MWSTREVAELAGTSLRTVRHYHEVGLLNEPERRSNGYKTYGVEHLVRLVWIRRMTGLGFSLAQIAAMDTDGVDDDAAAALDAKLAADIARLQGVREELRELRRSTAPSDLPPGLSEAATAHQLSPADRKFSVVLAQLVGPARAEEYARMLTAHGRTAAGDDFDRLPADADDGTIEDVTRRLVPEVLRQMTDFPELGIWSEEGGHDQRTAQRVILAALSELYNPAQLAVLGRVAVAAASAREEN